MVCSKYQTWYKSTSNDLKLFNFISQRILKKQFHVEQSCIFQHYKTDDNINKINMNIKYMYKIRAYYFFSRPILKIPLFTLKYLHFIANKCTVMN